METLQRFIRSNPGTARTQTSAGGADDRAVMWIVNRNVKIYLGLWLK
ncbi:MAG: hypothetical protein HC851_23110 [Acaryochloris sp. RU_4_1]|nr:hypothetical protein [Acaryochloris sp. RU_4_1]